MTPPNISPEATLLACPFCGELPEYQPRAHGNVRGFFWPHQVVHNCRILGIQMCIRCQLQFPDTKESVFQLWNTRAITTATAPLEKEVERLKAESENWKKRFQYNSIEISFLNDRVHRGEHSENCPFCKSYPATGRSQQAPMCHLCELESERDQLRNKLEQVECELQLIGSSCYPGDNFEKHFRDLFYRCEQIRQALHKEKHHE